MANEQAEIRKFVQIHAGICGVLFLLCGLLVFSCGVAALASQHDSVLYNYPLFGCGYILGFIGCAPWAIFTGITYLILACQSTTRKRSHCHKRMLEFQSRWSLFFMLLLIANLVVMGTALNLMVDSRIKAPTIVSIVSTGLVLFLTFMWFAYFPKYHGAFGLKVTSPDKATLLVSFKIHGAVFFLIGLHQLAWALVAFAVKGFDVPDEAIRIVAFSLGGFFNSLLALLAGLVCSLTVSYITQKKKDWKVKTKTMLMVHRTWTLLFLAFCIAGVALFANCFRTISKTNESGEWESSVLIVTSYVFSLVGNVLLGFMFLALTVLEKECTVFGIDVESKTTPTTPPPNPTPPASSNGSTTANIPTRTTAQSGTATTTVSTSTPKTTASTTVTKTTSIVTVSSTSGSLASTPATNGASGGNSNITDIEEIKERNRLLEEQIKLERQLNYLRCQRVSRPEDYPPLYVREAPDGPAPAPVPFPPSYEEVANFPGNH